MIWLKLLPFLTTAAIYFAFVTKEPEGELWTTVLKCFPTLGLMLFILLRKASDKIDSYSWKILLGLLFSVIGDALLNVDLFPHGMAAFGVAQIWYTVAYGFRPMKLHFSLPFYALGGGSEYFFLARTIVYNESILVCFVVFGKLDLVLKVGLPVYAVLLATMVWRSFVQAHTTPNFFNKLCALGSFLFAVSDGFIAINEFHVPIPLARVSFIVQSFRISKFINDFCSTTL